MVLVNHQGQQFDAWPPFIQPKLAHNHLRYYNSPKQFVQQFELANAGKGDQRTGISDDQRYQMSIFNSSSRSWAG